MHTYKVQEGLTGQDQSPQQAKLVLLGMEPHQAISSFWLTVLAGRASTPQGSPAQLSGVSIFRLRVPGAQSALEGELSHGKASLTWERESLWQERPCRRESLDASVPGF
jgi:hypothetical protein